MSELITRTYRLPPRCNIESVTVRETNGIDEQEAALAAEAKGTTIYSELVLLSIIEIDGDTVPGKGAAPMQQWNTRTRAAVRMIFDRLNDVSQAEMDPLFLEAETNGQTSKPSRSTQKSSAKHDKSRSASTG